MKTGTQLNKVQKHQQHCQSGDAANTLIKHSMDKMVRKQVRKEHNDELKKQNMLIQNLFMDHQAKASFHNNNLNVNTQTTHRSSHRDLTPVRSGAKSGQRRSQLMSPNDQSKNRQKEGLSRGRSQNFLYNSMAEPPAVALNRVGGKNIVSSKLHVNAELQSSTKPSHRGNKKISKNLYLTNNLSTKDEQQKRKMKQMTTPRPIASQTIQFTKPDKIMEHAQKDITNMFKETLKKNNKFQQLKTINQEQFSFEQQQQQKRQKPTRSRKSKETSQEPVNDVYSMPYTAMQINNFEETSADMTPDVSQKSNMLFKKSLPIMNFSELSFDVSNNQEQTNTINNNNHNQNIIRTKKLRQSRTSALGTLTSKSMENLQCLNVKRDPRFNNNQYLGRDSSIKNLNNTCRAQKKKNTSSIVVDDMMNSNQNNVKNKVAKNRQSRSKSKKAYKTEQNITNQSQMEDETKEQRKQRLASRSKNRKTKISKIPLTSYMKKLQQTPCRSDLKSNLNFTLTKPTLPFSPGCKKVERNSSQVQVIIDNGHSEDQQEIQNESRDYDKIQNDSQEPNDLDGLKKRSMKLQGHMSQQQLQVVHTPSENINQEYTDAMMGKSEQIDKLSCQVSDMGINSDQQKQSNQNDESSQKSKSKTNIVRSSWSRRSQKSKGNVILDSQKTEKAVSILENDCQKTDTMSDQQLQVENQSSDKHSQQPLHLTNGNGNISINVSIQDCEEQPENLDQVQAFKETSLQSLQVQIQQQGSILFPNHDKRKLIEQMLQQVLTQQESIMKFQETIKKQTYDTENSK